MKNKLTKLFVLLLSILAITCFTFACTPDSSTGTTGGGSGNGEQNKEIDDGDEKETSEHNHSYTLKFDSNNHWQECSCGDKKDTAKHSGGTATCKIKAKCSTCEQEYGDIGEHSYVNGRCECLEYESTYYTEGLIFELHTDKQSYYVDDYNGKATEVVIPSIYQNKPVTSIGGYAFCDCSKLTSIEIPNSVTSIGSFAFWKCTALTSVTIGNSVTSIGNDAFSGCDSLTSITVDENNEYYKSMDGNLYSKDGKIIITYALGKTATSFVIPQGVTSIGDYAFYGCSSLTSIEIPNSVTSIGGYAFCDCIKLTSIEIPNSVTSIGGVAFAYCRSLISIEIPNSVTSIGDAAFEYCSSLTSIEIPNSVTSIGCQVFVACDSLRIYCEATEKPSDWDTDWNITGCPVVWGYTGK